MDENNVDQASTASGTGPEPKKNSVLVIGVVLVILALAFFFLRGSDNADPLETTEMNMEGSMATGTESEGNKMDTMDGSESSSEAETGSAVKNITMEAGSFYYSVKEIKVKEGEKVKITLNGKDMMHDFVIDELGVKSEVVKAGGTVTVEFVASKKGTFEYYCSIGQHRKNGQVGKIIVE